MREHEQRYTPARLLLRRGVLVALAVIFLATLQGAWHAYMKERETRAGRTQAETELGHLKDRHAQLAGEVANLKTDEGVERELREQFNVGKPGEQLIIVVDQASGTKTDSELKSLPWWKRIFGR